jgi:hypothetical protein
MSQGTVDMLGEPPIVKELREIRSRMLQRTNLDDPIVAGIADDIARIAQICADAFDEPLYATPQRGDTEGWFISSGPIGFRLTRDQANQLYAAARAGDWPLTCKFVRKWFPRYFAKTGEAP